MSLRKSRSSHAEKALSPEEQQAKINEVRKLIAPLSEKLPNFCTDASISRYLQARNWNTEKASKMLKETLKWRLEYKPEAIQWDCINKIMKKLRGRTPNHCISFEHHALFKEDIAHEAETGKIYRADYCDKNGRAVLVMRPGFQNTSSTKGQIKYLVYCLENAILNLAADQQQMVWLIDFQGWTMGSVSVKVTRETAHVLQDYYPERLALGILYNPPRIFESFWKVVKPFLEPKTYNKVKFVYSDDTESQKIITDIFDMDKLEFAFGGRNPVGFDYNQYAERMKEDDKRMTTLLSSGHSTVINSQEQPLDSILQRSASSKSEAHSEEALSATSSSTDIPSPEAEVTSKLEEKELKEKLSCKISVVADTEHQPDSVQIKESF